MNFKIFVFGFLTGCLIVTAGWFGYKSFFKKRIDRFEGQVGHLDQGQSFVDFIDSHDKQIVYLDIYMDGAEISSPTSNRSNVFTIYTSCLDEEISALTCSGGEYLVYLDSEDDAYFEYHHGENYLRGYWFVTTNTAIHQGIISNVLKAIPGEEVFLRR
ncbi:MAG: hypothetical protein H6867_09070 [Rhodospirillales bacterium]|nr:hypothetical protein [Rhodospirillales bacterium]MCB9996043.1 hypothetical protein [Rhodospirillales bacterium]